jgi:hypothetical protein
LIYIFDLYQGAAGCDLTKGFKIGTVAFSHNTTYYTLMYTLFSGVTASAIHNYAGNNTLPPTPGIPGSYPDKEDPTIPDPISGSFTRTYLLSGTNTTVVYLVTHMNSCYTPP